MPHLSFLYALLLISFSAHCLSGQELDLSDFGTAEYSTGSIALEKVEVHEAQQAGSEAVSIFASTSDVSGDRPEMNAVTARKRIQSGTLQLIGATILLCCVVVGFILHNSRQRDIFGSSSSGRRRTRNTNPKNG